MFFQFYLPVIPESMISTISRILCGFAEKTCNIKEFGYAIRPGFAGGKFGVTVVIACTPAFFVQNQNLFVQDNIILKPYASDESPLFYPCLPLLA